MAAAIGAGLDVEEATGCMVVDVGGGGEQTLGEQAVLVEQRLEQPHVGRRRGDCDIGYPRQHGPGRCPIVGNVVVGGVGLCTESVSLTSVVGT